MFFFYFGVLIGFVYFQVYYVGQNNLLFNICDYRLGCKIQTQAENELGAQVQ